MQPEPRAEQTLAQVLARRAARAGDRPFIATAEGELSYRDVDRLSNRLAHGLKALGLAPGDTLLLMLADTVEFIALWCAAAKLGIIEVPVNVHLRGSVLAHVINDSRARTMVIDAGFVERVEAIAGDVGGLERLIVYAQEGEALAPAPAGRFETVEFARLVCDDATPPADGPRYTDLMAVMYTSGTTGPSKGVMVTHAHAYEYARACVELLELRPGDVYYAPLPLFHIAGQWAVVYACCLVEATAVLPRSFTAEGFWADVRRFGATCTFLLGAMASFLHRQPPREDDAQNPLERALVVPLLPEVEAFKRRFGCRVSTTWGSTEVNVPTRSGFELADHRTCGRVAEDRYEVRIVDGDDNELPPGVPGEAVVRAREPWILMAGYWGHPEWTVAAWRNLWLHSGDMLMRDEAGNLYFVDRVKDAIRRRGENISSMEVEREILAHPDVLECAVVPVESEFTEQEVMVVVVPKAGRTIDPAELVRFLEPRMAYFMVPRYVELVEGLPKTQTGKIRKYRLRARGLTSATWDRERAGLTVKR